MQNENRHRNYTSSVERRPGRLLRHRHEVAQRRLRSWIFKSSLRHQRWFTKRSHVIHWFIMHNAFVKRVQQVCPSTTTRAPTREIFGHREQIPAATRPTAGARSINSSDRLSGRKDSRTIRAATSTASPSKSPKPPLCFRTKTATRNSDTFARWFLVSNVEIAFLFLVSFSVQRYHQHFQQLRGYGRWVWSSLQCY